MIAIDNSRAKTENLSCSRISDRSTYIVHPRNNKYNDVSRMYNINNFYLLIFFIINEKNYFFLRPWESNFTVTCNFE